MAVPTRETADRTVTTRQTDLGELPFDALDTDAEEIDRRYAWARHRGHPQYLWPSVSVSSWRASLHSIADATTDVLTHPGRPVSLTPRRGSDARALGIAAFTSGMGPLLGYWIESGQLEAAPEVASILRLHLWHGRVRAERLAQRLEHVLQELHHQGVTATVLKGAHTGAVYFPEPATRPISDIDLAVAPPHVEQTETVLRAAGLVRVKQQSRPRKSTWSPTPEPQLRSLELTHADNPWAVEIHESLDRDFYGVRMIRVGSLDSDCTTEWRAGEIPTRVLAQPWLLAYLALHASEEFHQIQLVRMVELVLVIRADLASGRLAWGDVLSLLDRAHATRFAFPALQLAERLLPGTLDETLLTKLAGAATPSMRRVIDGLEPGDAQRLDRVTLQERFMWAKGPIETLRRLGRFIVPSGTDVPLRTMGSMQWSRLMRVVRGRVSLRETRASHTRATTPANEPARAANTPRQPPRDRQQPQTAAQNSKRSESPRRPQHPK